MKTVTTVLALIINLVMDGVSICWEGYREGRIPKGRGSGSNIDIHKTSLYNTSITQ